MSKYDRYVLSQLLLFFGFFALILVAVFWINRAVVLFDRLIGDGHSALVFLEFSALGMPNLIRMVLPMACFAAAVFVTNRLNSESELTVMQATGSSPWRLARPFLAFGVVTALMMSVLTHFLLPASLNQLAERESEISQNVSARLLTEGAFLHPADGVTLYIRDIGEDGVLQDIFLSDRRQAGENTIYTANQAYLVRNGGQARMIMVDGIAQRYLDDGRRLSTTSFADFTNDITSLVKTKAATTRRIREVPTAELMFDKTGVAEKDRQSPGQIAEELHLRFARALICIAIALVGFSTLMLGAFSRFGVWRQGLLAFVLLILLEMMRGIASEPVLKNPDLWPVIYLPTLIGIALAMIFLRLAGRPLLPRRRDAAALGAT